MRLEVVGAAEVGVANVAAVGGLAGVGALVGHHAELGREGQGAVAAHILKKKI